LGPAFRVPKTHLGQSWNNSPFFDPCLLLHDLFLFLWVNISQQACLSLQLIHLNLLNLQLTFKDLQHKT